MSADERLATLSPEQKLLVQLLAERRKAGPGMAAPVPRPAAPTHGPLEPFGLLSEADRAKIPAGVVDAFPPARLQLAMLYHLEMTAGDEIPAYHNVNSFHVEAPFDADRFREALRRVIASNPMMRAAFDLDGFSEPLVLVHGSAEPKLQVEDLRPLDDERRREALERYWSEEQRHLFDLSVPPLMRFGIHLFGDREFHLTLTELHAISEGWGTANILAEIADLYFPLLAGEEPSAPPPPAVSYAEFIRLERQALASEASRRFWRSKLEGCTVVRPPRWPGADRPSRRSIGRKTTLTVPAAVAGALDRLGRREGLPAKSVLLAAHLKVMSLISGEIDLLVGIQCHGRPEEVDGDRVHGVFINTVPLRCDVSAGSWVELARRAFEAETELLPHRRFPLAALQQGWGEEALIETNFTYLHFHSIRRLEHSEHFRLRGGAGVDRSVTHFPLMIAFHLMESGDPPPLLFFLERDDAELTAAQSRLYLGYYQRVLAAMAEEPEALHHTRSFLTAAERHQALVEWNDTAVSYPEPPVLHRLIELRARHTPDAVAVSFGERSLSYAELDRQAEGLARHLRRAGRPGVVAVFLKRGPEMMIALLGVLKAGGAYLPIDPDHPRGRLAFVLEQSESAAVLTVAELENRLPESRAEVIRLDLDRPLFAAAGDDDGPEVGAEDLAYVIYTSGTTGRPKGVMNLHGAVVNRLLWMRDAYGLGTDDRVLQKTPYSFDVSVWELFLPLIVGGRLVFARPEGHKDSAYLAATLAAERITAVHFVPSMLQIFLEDPGIGRYPSLRRIVTSGEALSAELRQRCLETLDCELHNLYGPTEAAIDVTAWDAGRGPYPERVPIGRPIANAAIHVLGPELQPSPIGVPGELHIGGRPLACGYLGNAEETALRFVPHPFSERHGARLYRTGDLVRRLPDGNLEYLGRNDHQVKLRGFRIELGEIESHLRRHPAVNRTVVMVRRDGGGEGRLVAYVVSSHDAEPTVARLRTYLRARLPEYMVPSVFVPLDELPLTANGKLDRRALPAPSQSRPELKESLVVPRNDTERTLAGLWQEVLQVEQVGVFDNFFDLGGDSLLLLRLHRMVRQKLGSEIAITDLFRHPTIAAFADSLAAREGTAEEPEFEREAQRAQERKSAADRQRQRRQKRSRIREL